MGHSDSTVQATPNVLWIGGPPGAGKSTVARWIARRRGLRWYNSDTRTWIHRDRALAAGIPAAITWEALTPAQRWAQPVERMFEQALHSERGPMIAQDVRSLPGSPLVVAEGTAVAPGIIGPGQAAVWLMPTKQWQRDRLAERELSAGVTALYLRLADQIRNEVSQSKVEVFDVDGSLTIEETVAALERRFAATLATGPVAATVSGRRALLRYANTAVAQQYRGFFARPWSPPIPQDAVLVLCCECAGEGCQEMVELPLRRYQGLDEDADPVVAAGHAPGAGASAESDSMLPTGNVEFSLRKDGQ